MRKRGVVVIIGDERGKPPRRSPAWLLRATAPSEPMKLPVFCPSSAWTARARLYQPALMRVCDDSCAMILRSANRPGPPLHPPPRLTSATITPQPKVRATNPTRPDQRALVGTAQGKEPEREAIGAVHGTRERSSPVAGHRRLAGVAGHRRPAHLPAAERRAHHPDPVGEQPGVRPGADAAPAAAERAPARHRDRHRAVVVADDRRPGVPGLRGGAPAPDPGAGTGGGEAIS